MIRRFQVTVPATGHGGRTQPVWRVGSVLKFCLGLSRVERVRIWRTGGVAVNGRPVTLQHVHCYPGDDVVAWYPAATSGVRPESDLPLDVLYEDDVLLAVAKPAGQLSHPARSEQSGTVANAVAARYRVAPADGGDLPPPSHAGAPDASGDPTDPGSPGAPDEVGARGAAPDLVRPVHRLDRDTSGILLFARDSTTARTLARQRVAGVLVREYLALVAGHPPPKGQIDLPLGPDPRHRTRRRVLRPEPARLSDVTGLPDAPGLSDVTGRPDLPGPAAGSGAAPPALPPGFQEAHTTYQVVQYGAGTALVVARLRTGRTHQVRAHFAAVGHPLLADDLYDGPPSAGLDRQALHAWRTRLRHPASGEHLTLVAPLPVDLKRAIRRAIRLAT